MLFQTSDHGALLRLVGKPRKTVQYLLGNPLIAVEMTRHAIGAAQYAPLRVLIYEAVGDETCVEYDLPSLFGKRAAKPVLPRLLGCWVGPDSPTQDSAHGTSQGPRPRTHLGAAPPAAGGQRPVDTGIPLARGDLTANPRSGASRLQELARSDLTGEPAPRA